MALVRLVNSLSTPRNSAGAPDRPEVNAQPSFQASCESAIISPTDGNGPIFFDGGDAPQPEGSRIAAAACAVRGDVVGPALVSTCMREAFGVAGIHEVPMPRHSIPQQHQLR